MEENKKQALSEIANMIFERRMETAKVMKAYISDTITNIEGLLSMSEIIGDVCSVKDDLKKGKLSVMAAQRNAHDYNFWVCFYPYGKNGELWSSPSVRHLIDTATPEDIFSDIKLLTLLYVGVEKSNELLQQESEKIAKTLEHIEGLLSENNLDGDIYSATQKGKLVAEPTRMRYGDIIYHVVFYPYAEDNKLSDKPSLSYYIETNHETTAINQIKSLAQDFTKEQNNTCITKE